MPRRLNEDIGDSAFILIDERNHAMQRFETAAADAVRCTVQPKVNCRTLYNTMILSTRRTRKWLVVVRPPRFVHTRCTVGLQFSNIKSHVEIQ